MFGAGDRSSIYVSTEGVIKQGWLFKTGEVVKSLKKRLFILAEDGPSNALLQYYDGAAGAQLKQKGVISLQDVWDIQLVENDPIAASYSPSTPDISSWFSINAFSFGTLDKDKEKDKEKEKEKDGANSSNSNTLATFALLTNGRVFTLHAANPHEREQWIAAIKPFVGQKIVMSGWLVKIAGDFVKSRKRRFFILDHRFIRYYESENAVAQELAKGTIELQHVVQVKTIKNEEREAIGLAQNEKGFPFAIDTDATTNNRSYILVGSTEPERDGWITKIFQEMLFVAARNNLLDDKETAGHSPIIKSPAPLTKSGSFWSTDTSDELIDAAQVTKESEMAKNVWTGTFKASKVVIKELGGVEGFSELNFKQTLKQIRSFDSQYLNKIYGGYVRPTPTIVAEYISHKGSLRDKLNQAEDFTWVDYFEIALSIASGLVFLHYKCVPSLVHGKLNPRNIMITQNGYVKLTDYCVKTAVTKQQFDPYLAPEATSGHSNTASSDVYSFAIILWEMLQRLNNQYDPHWWNTIFHEDEEKHPSLMNLDFLAKVLQGERPPLLLPSELAPAGLLDIVSQSWVTNPTMRLTSAQILGRLKELKERLAPSVSLPQNDEKPPQTPPRRSVAEQLPVQKIVISHKMCL